MKNTLRTIMIACTFIMISFSSAHASDLAAKQNEIVFEVHGIVCSFCSKGVQKKLSKLDFVDKTKHIDGVHVAIEDQRITMAIKPGVTVDIDKAFEAIISGGYDPIQAVMLGEDGSKQVFKPRDQ